MSVDEYKGENYMTLDKRLIKRLLGAMSNMYDSQLEKSGTDPKALRKLLPNFKSYCNPINEKLYKKFQKLSKVSFNYFDTVDTYEVADGWTDYGDEDNHHTGLRIETDTGTGSFRIIAVKFREYNSPLFNHEARYSSDDLKLLEEREISSLELFHLMGVEPFRMMADLVDWETIIKSF